jgi:hypothetical protein
VEQSVPVFELRRLLNKETGFDRHLRASSPHTTTGQRGFIPRLLNAAFTALVAPCSSAAGGTNPLSLRHPFEAT